MVTVGLETLVRHDLYGGYVEEINRLVRVPVTTQAIEKFRWLVSTQSHVT